jgi:hypothetical protein
MLASGMVSLSRVAFSERIEQASRRGRKAWPRRGGGLPCYGM